MTELEWLKEKSGLTEDELKAFEGSVGSTKFVAMLQKMIGENEAAIKAKEEAERTRLDFEKRYNEEFVPEMRRVTQDALAAKGEAARIKAQLEQAKQYGIVLDDDKPQNPQQDPPRAPGSPDPNVISREDFNRFSQSQANTILALQDLNAKHFKLYGEPLGDTEALVAEVQKQRTLGNRDYSLEKAWETKYNVAAKRDELAKASRQKEIDEAVAAARKADAEARGSNPHLRMGQTSRFSTYKPTDSTGEPWKAPRSINERNRPWREKAVQKVREHIAVA